MRKLALLSVMAVSVVALSACGKKDNNVNPGTTESTSQIETTTEATQEPSKEADESDAQGAVKLLDDIWAVYGEDDKFPAAGGDYNPDNERDDAAGKYGLEDSAAINDVFGIAEDDVALIDDAASLGHMMNANTFTAGAFHVTDKENVAAIAEHLKDGILERQWMCGFPDVLVVYQVDDYIVSAYGLTDIIDTFSANLSEVYPDAVELYKENIG